MSTQHVRTGLLGITGLSLLVIVSAFLWYRPEHSETLIQALVQEKKDKPFVIIFDKYSCGSNYQLIANYLLNNARSDVALVTSEEVYDTFFRKSNRLGLDVEVKSREELKAYFRQGSPVLINRKKDGSLEINAFAPGRLTLGDLILFFDA